MAKKEQMVEPPPPAAPASPESKTRPVYTHHFWAALAVIALWVSVTLVGVYAKTDLVISSKDSHVEIPVVWGVALFATVATWVIVVNAFRDD
jgi:hypothetical protein